MKTCSSCKEIKDESAFNPPTANYIYNQCKACKTASNKKHYHNNKEYYHSNALRKYIYKGRPMNGTDYKELLAYQEGHCALCPDIPKERVRRDGAVTPAGRFEVDHDHVTKEVRGLVCPSCNKLLIGMHRDQRTLDIISKLKDYIFNNITNKRI